MVDHEFAPVGVPAIDEEHRELLGLLNAVLAAVAGGEPLGAVRRQGETILDRLANHFASEERTMANICYADSGRHASVHADLLVTAGRELDAAIEPRHAASWATRLLQRISHHQYAEDLLLGIAINRANGRGGG